MTTPHIPSREALEATHAFPGTYLFKAVGPNAPAFRDAVERAIVEGTDAAEAVRAEDGSSLRAAHRVSVRESSSGAHVAVSVEALFPDAGSVQEAYRRLAAVPGILLIL
jgi:putative lipoic acid-binding regulatory protein